MTKKNFWIFFSSIKFRVGNCPITFFCLFATTPLPVNRIESKFFRIESDLLSAESPTFTVHTRLDYSVNGISIFHLEMKSKTRYADRSYQLSCSWFEYQILTLAHHQSWHVRLQLTTFSCGVRTLHVCHGGVIADDNIKNFSWRVRRAVVKSDLAVKSQLMQQQSSRPLSFDVQFMIMNLRFLLVN